jgi:uncharacterized membrane protein
MPAHVLLVHFMVVLVPLTALLEILCGLWPAARRRLVWLVLVLAVGIMALTPVTVDAGEWLYDLRKEHSAILQTHAQRAEWMIYFSVALLVVAIAFAVLQVLEHRSDTRRAAANVLVAIVALAVGISSIVVIYRIGDAGSQSVWGEELSRLTKSG